MEEEIKELTLKIQSLLGIEDPAERAEEIEKVLTDEVIEEVGYDGYREAVDAAMAGAGYPKDEEAEEAAYPEPKDDEGEYTPEGLRDHLALIANDTDVDNSLEVGDYSEVHYGIDQHNVTNTANANAEGAIAGANQDGQFQTGDGVQVGAYNEGVVNQGDNSGQIAGNDAWAEDINSGENILTNEGGYVEGAIAFGDGAKADDADVESFDGSTNDSYNQHDVGNTRESYNDDNVGNTDISHEHTVDANLHADVDVDSPYYEEKEYGHDDHGDDHEHADDYVSD